MLKAWRFTSPPSRGRPHHELGGPGGRENFLPFLLPKLRGGPQGLRAAGYIRYSPREEVGYSEEMQLEAITKRCELKGWELAKVFYDRKKTGKKLARREGLAGLLEGVRRKEYGAVVVYKVDRLARNLRDLLNLLNEFGESGAAFSAADLPDIDPFSAWGQATLQMIGVFAQLEGMLISERTKDGLAEAREAGKRIGRPPFGYRVGPSGLELTPLGARAKEILGARPEIKLSELAEELSSPAITISVKQAWQLKRSLRS